MTRTAFTTSDELAIATRLINGVIDRASGRASAECLLNAPQDVYFIGSLRSRLDVRGGTPVPGELLSKLAPFALGAEVLLAPNSDFGGVDVTIHWCHYYRAFPSYAQQRAHQFPANAEESTTETEVPDGLPDTADDEQTEDSADQQNDLPFTPAIPATPAPSPATRARRRQPTDSMMTRFKRIEASATATVTVTQEGSVNWTLDCSGLQTAVDAEATRCAQVVAADPERYRSGGAADANVRVPDSAVISDFAFRTFLDTLRTEVRPAWRLEITTNARRHRGSNSVIFGLDVTNASGPVNNPNIEHFVFDVTASLTSLAWDTLPFEIDLAPRGFRYSREMWGQGFNCAVERTSPRTFQTTHSPIYRQLRYVTRSEPAARFADLAIDPLPVVRRIEESMRSYRDVWLTARQEFSAASPRWEGLHGLEFDQDFAAFDSEMNRFSRGVRLLEDDADCRSAFMLMNETFGRLGASAREDRRKTQWRLFQIVFIVSQIPGFYGHKTPSPELDADLSIVDVIYFPTGGGKTEAYLGTITYSCFFDRLRGKTAGVTCWTRFPLRLLTLQQTQRMADAIGVAELIRRASPDGRLSGGSVDGFAVGYFVGAEGTPNELVGPSRGTNRRQPRDEVNWSRALDVAERQLWKRIALCPHCQTDSVTVDFDPDAVRLIHRCTNSDCAFPQGALPVLVVDNDIYRYLPAVVVGTVDKLASIGNQRKMSLLFGNVEGRCTRHGYYSGICCQKGCRDRSLLRPQRPAGLSGPTLLVQDELHLLKEGLGTFDSHYETFIQRLSRELGSLSFPRFS